MSLAKFIVEKLYEDINEKKREQESLKAGDKSNERRPSIPSQEQKSIKKLLNKMEARAVAEIFTNNDDMDGDNLTYSDIQLGIM